MLFSMNEGLTCRSSTHHDFSAALSYYNSGVWKPLIFKTVDRDRGRVEGET